MDVLFIPIIMALIIMALIISVILSFYFKDKPKKDKGFTFNYYQLSYRRKFKRTLMMLPIATVFILLIYFVTDWTSFVKVMFAVFLLVLFIGQTIYNYYMWKRNEA